MSKNKEFVKFDKVDKSYDGKVLVVKDLNLDIEEGEFVTMLGPSGSGKTTCLMMLAGFETPTNGEIYLNSNPISNSMILSLQYRLRRGWSMNQIFFLHPLGYQFFHPLNAVFGQM